MQDLTFYFVLKFYFQGYSFVGRIGFCRHDHYVSFFASAITTIYFLNIPLANLKNFVVPYPFFSMKKGEVVAQGPRVLMLPLIYEMQDSA